MARLLGEVSQWKVRMVSVCVGPTSAGGGFQGFVEKERDMRFCKRQAGAGDVVQVVESLSSMQGAPHLILSIT